MIILLTLAPLSNKNPYLFQGGMSDSHVAWKAVFSLHQLRDVLPPFLKVTVRSPPLPTEMMCVKGF